MKFSIKKVALLVFLIAMCSVLSFAVSAENMTISADTVTVEAGSTETIAVPVRLTNNTAGLSSIKIAVEVPDGFVLSSITNGELSNLATANKSLALINLTPTIDPSTNEGAILEDGILAYFNFTLDGATAGDHDFNLRVMSAFDLDFGVPSFVNSENEAFTIADAADFVKIGTITVTKPNLVISADTVTVEEGSIDTITVPVKLTKNVIGLSSIKIAVEVPNGFTLSNITNGELSNLATANKSLALINLTPTIDPSTNEGAILEDGVLANFIFTLNGATPGDYDFKLRVMSAFDLDFGVPSFVNSESEIFTIGDTADFVKIGTITVTERQNPVLTAGTITVADDYTDTFEVPIELKRNPGLASFGSLVRIPEGFSLEAVEDGIATFVPDLDLDFNAYFMEAYDISDSDVMATLTLKRTTAGAGESYNIEICLYDATMTSGDPAEIYNDNTDMLTIDENGEIFNVVGTIVSKPMEYTVSAGLTLGTNVGIHFGNVSASTDFDYYNAVDNSKVEISVNNVAQTLTDGITPAFYNAAKDFLQDTWTISVKYDGVTVIDGLEVTWEDYAEAVTGNEKLLVDALITYCKYAANYFGTATYALPSLDINTVNVVNAGSFPSEATDYLTYQFTSLILSDTIKLRHYFLLGTKTPYQYVSTQGTQVIDGVEYIYLEADSNIADLENTVTISYKSTKLKTISYIASPLAYIKVAQNDASSKNGVSLADMTMALYNYYLAAEAYNG